MNNAYTDNDVDRGVEAISLLISVANDPNNPSVQVSGDNAHFLIRMVNEAKFREAVWKQWVNLFAPEESH
jgi:hypothetical protein